MLSLSCEEWDMSLPKPEGVTEIPLPLSLYPMIMTKQDVLTPNLFLKLNSNSSEDIIPRASLAVWKERNYPTKLREAEF